VAEENLRSTDEVVLESSTNTWDVYDTVAPLVKRVVVAHPAEVKQIANARVKTDNQDVVRLLRLLIADMIPEVWVPPAVTIIRCHDLRWNERAPLARKPVIVKTSSDTRGLTLPQRMN
jgi:hypothetical protein